MPKLYTPDNWRDDLVDYISTLNKNNIPVPVNRIVFTVQAILAAFFDDIKECNGDISSIHYKGQSWTRKS